MTGTKTNERPGTRAQVKNVRMSATKARAVLDLIRGLAIDEAASVLAYTERGAAEVVGKCLDSAIANAEHNDQIDPATLFVSACYADEGRTMYRWRPRARGRATKIRKRTCHITIIVSPMPADMFAIEQAKREAVPGTRAARRRGQEASTRAARVAASQQSDDVAESAEDAGIVDTDAVATEAVEGVDETTEVSAPPADDSVAEVAEDQGIVDTDAAATEALDETDVTDDAAESADDDSTEEK
ncbi:50S ribosomal protein L22 [Acidimicrobiia bacterium EGI L10123]|uniref:50S ribosomal protein L22 n=1 Tax=Salinilacustrithrix flava TaxID=2957203 RepID=UPI003D7C144C|nr:50S ribosomal protein L22 [Acidimicrobiia bacterium EGI L10123]